MKLSLIGFGVLPVFLSVALFSAAIADTNADKSGRAGSWRKATQGAPDLKTARAKVEKTPKDAGALNDLGFALRQNGKLDEAEKYLKQAVEIKPEMGEAHANLSVVYYDQSKFQDALAEGKKAVNADANQAVFRVVLGNALSKTGDLKGAAQEYRVALHLKPDYENAHYNLGRVLNEDGQVTEAKLSLSKALEIDPNDERVIMLLDKLEKSESGTKPSADDTTGSKKKTNKG